MKKIEFDQPFYHSLKLPHFLILFVFIYIIGHKLFQKWGPKIRYEACTCFLSLFHGTPSVILSIFTLFIINKDTQEIKKINFGAKNTCFQNLVLEFSISYFIMDLLHYLVFIPNDVLFIAHHLATLFVLLTCRFLVHHGAPGILIILILAEITSPFQIVWSLLRLRIHDSHVAKKLCDFISPGFYVFYTIIRGFIAPVFVVKLVFVYASGEFDGYIPTWAWCSWMLVTSCGILGSMLWILNHWVVYYREKIMKAKSV